MDSSTEVNVSPGNSQAAKVMPVMGVWSLAIVKLSLTMKPKLMVQASVLPLAGPLS